MTDPKGGGSPPPREGAAFSEAPGQIARWKVRWLAALRSVGGALLGEAGLPLSSPRYVGPVSGHFDGRRFQNVPSAGRTRPAEVARWLLTRRAPRWVDSSPQVPVAPPPPEVEGDTLRVTFVNHSTVLVQVPGFHFLTDPIWSQRAGPGSIIGPARVRPPGVRFEDLPRIDAVFLSHNHYDHLDLATLGRLASRHRPRIFTGLGNAALLRRAGIPGGVELDWWEEAAEGEPIRITAVPAHHFSGRGARDADTSLWCGFVIHTPQGSIYFAGDTGWGSHFGAIRRRLGRPRLSLLPIGAYLPRWIMAPVHLSPAEAVQAHRALQSSTSVGIHFGTFRLADEAQDEAPAALAAALHDEDRFWVLAFGEGRDVAPLG